MQKDRIRLLLAEDNEGDAELELRELKRAGLRIESRVACEEGAFVRELHEFVPDVILSDFSMPGFDGMEALRLSKRFAPDIPFIFVSGTLGEDYAIRALKDGATDYVLKTNLLRLPAAIERAIEGALERRERRKAEQNYRSVFNNATSGIFLMAPDGRVTSANPALARMLGYETPEKMLAGIGDASHQVYVDAAEARRYREMLTTEGTVANFEMRWRRTDGSEIWVSLNGREVRDEKGGILHQLGMAEDITERRQAEIHIRRLNRVYAVLSGINSLIVRARSREDLFREACRIAVDAGKFPLAWIGMVDKAGEKMDLQASAGDGADYLALLPMTLSFDGARGIAGTAVHERRPVVANDLRTDTRVRTREQAVAHGYLSYIALPLIVAGEVVGVMAFYAEQAGFFDEEEVKLLRELAGDIAFAMDHIDKAERLEYLSYYDPLTGLANRMLLQDRLSQGISTTPAGKTLAFVVVDLSGFKTINDSLGRDAGDALLVAITKRLVGLAGEASRVARVGADQFAVIIPSVSREEQVARALEEGFRRIEGEPYPLAGTDLRIAIKTGIALYPNDGADADSIFRNAEAALKKAKAGGDKYLFYTQKMNERVSERLGLENRLRQAIEKEEFVLHYQPKVDLAQRRIIGAEALIRWQTPEGLVPPVKFIPLLEETGLIMEVGSWALRRAVSDHAALFAQGLDAPRIAVNVSPIQLRQANFVALVEQAITAGVTPTALDLEVTESLAMEDVQANVTKLEAIRRLGVNIAIDDFGTGYSSLGYLAKLPVQALKIDRSFIIAMEQDANAFTLVSTMISLAHSLNLTVIAEGVETEAQANTLRRLRCDAMQGYLFSKPVPRDQLAALLGAR